MDTLFHFLMPLIAALAARIKVRESMKLAFVLAFWAALLDVDHIFGVTRATLHNVFVTFLLPFSFLILALVFEKGGVYFKKISIYVLLFVSSHPILDLFTEKPGVALFYPLSDSHYSLMPYLNDFSVALPIGYSKYTLKLYSQNPAEAIISTASVALFVYMIIIFIVIFLDRYFEEWMQCKSYSGSIPKTIQGIHKIAVASWTDKGDGHAISVEHADVFASVGVMLISVSVFHSYILSDRPGIYNLVILVIGLILAFLSSIFIVMRIANNRPKAKNRPKHQT